MLGKKIATQVMNLVMQAVMSMVMVSSPFLPAESTDTRSSLTACTLCFWRITRSLRETASAS